MGRSGVKDSTLGNGTSGSRRNRSAGGELPSDIAAADYLLGVLPELKRVADRNGLEVAAYLLEMALVSVEEEVSAKQTSAVAPD